MQRAGEDCSTMKLLASVDRKDRMLLLGCGALLAILVAVLALFSPANDDDDPTPSSYSTAPQGAKAAFELLGQAGYPVERQVEPLGLLENRVDEHATVVIAEPFLQNVSASRESVKAILDKGARVLVTGFAGGLLVPDNAVQSNGPTTEDECDAEPNGFGELAASGTIRIARQARWKQANPLHQVAYTCGAEAVAVTYKAGKGTVVWWAHSLPLENSGIQRADNLVFFLNSVGPATTTRVFWDESLHGDSPSLLSYTRGTPLKWIGWQLVLAAALLLWSHGRRSGPLRPDPAMPRTTQIEFVHSLGSLYQAANATQIAVSGAYQHFRQRLEQLFGIPQSLSAQAPGMRVALAQYFNPGSEHLQQTLQQTMVACEEAIAMEKLAPKTALARVQALHDYDDSMYRRMPTHLV
jgi:hypothetical protein